MDLKNDKITLGELWDDPRSRSVTLEQLRDFMAGWVPGMMVNGVMSDLKKL